MFWCWEFSDPINFFKTMQKSLNLDPIYSTLHYPCEHELFIHLLESNILLIRIFLLIIWPCSEIVPPSPLSLIILLWQFTAEGIVHNCYQCNNFFNANNCLKIHKKGELIFRDNLCHRQQQFIYPEVGQNYCDRSLIFRIWKGIFAQNMVFRHFTIVENMAV